MKHIFTPARILLLPLTALLCTGAYAQAPKWEADTKGAIQWQRTNEFGSLIVGTSNGIKGIDPETGSVSWTTGHELAHVPDEDVNVIQGTPFFSVLSPGKKNKDLTIINAFDGKTVFSSVQSNIERMIGHYILHKSGAILVLGYEPGTNKPSVHMIDMSTGNKLWSKPSDFGMITGYTDLGGDFIAVTTFFVYRINVKTGDVVWKKVIDPRYEKMEGFAAALDKGGGNLAKDKIVSLVVINNAAPDDVFIGAQVQQEKTSTDSKGQTTKQLYYESFYMGFDLKTGAYKWSEAIKRPGTTGIMIPDANGLIVSQGDGTDINCIDYATGQLKWGKKGRGIDVKDKPITGSAYIGSKLVISCGDRNSYVDILDPATGTFVFEKPYKVDGIVNYIEEIPAGFVVASNEEVVVLGNNGLPLTAKPFAAHSKLIKTHLDRLYIFNNKDKLVYAVDRNTGKAAALGSSAVEFKGKEKASSIEVNDKGIFVLGEQNLALVDMQGNIKHNTYFEAPQDGNLKRALLYANAVYGAYYGVATGLTSAAFAGTSSQIQVKTPQDKMAKDLTAQVGRAYGDASNSALSYSKQMLEKANKRYKATTNADDYMFILTEKEKKHYMLYRVNKEDGKVLSEIDLAKDKTPVYEIDPIDKKVYYRYKDNLIKCYAF